MKRFDEHGNSVVWLGRGIVKGSRDRLRQRIVVRRIAREGLRGDRRCRGKAAQSEERLRKRIVGKRPEMRRKSEARICEGKDGN